MRFTHTVFGLVFCVLPYVTLAVTTTWTNANSTNLWSDASNWSAGVPGTADIAQFNNSTSANCTISSNIDVQGISILGTYSGTIVQNTGVTITVGTGNYSQAGGTFAGGNGAIDVNGVFVLSGGSFQSTSTTLTIGGTFSGNTTLFTQSGGTFTPNAGKVTFDPYRNSCGTTTYTIDVLTTTTFYDIEFNGTQSCSKSANFATATGDTVHASHDIIHTNGYINGLWEVQNDLYIGSSADGGLGTIIVNGTGAQNYDVASSSVRTCIIMVDKSAGVFSPATGTTDFNMQGFELVQGSFTAPSGTMAVGGTFSGSTTLLTHTAGTFSHNNGKVEFDPYRNSCGATTYTIDVLTSTEFYDIEFSGSQSCGKSALFTTGAGDTVNATNDLLQTNGYLNGMWEVKNDLYLGASADGGLGMILFNGGGAQEYDVASSAVRSCVIGVDKAAGTVSPATGTTDFNVQGFELIQGSFTAPTGTMSIGGTFSGSSTLFAHTAGTFSHNNGKVEFDPYRNSCGATTYTVDVLTSTEFYDIEFSGSQSCGKSALFTTGTGDTVNATNDLIQTNGYLNGMWEVKNDLYLGASADGGLGMILFDGSGTQEYDVASSSVRTCVIAVDKSAGTVTPATGTTDFNMQGFELIQGSFTAPSGTMSIGGTFSSSTTLFAHTAGTFNHNNGKVDFDPYRSSCSATNYTVDVLTSTEFYDIEFSGSQSCGKSALFTTGTGDTVNATNDLIQTNGYLNGMWEVKNDLYLGASADGGLGMIIFNGSGAQEYDVASGSVRTCVIAVDKAAGAVTPATGTTDFSMQGFELLQGSFTAPSGTMSIGGTFYASATLFTHASGTFVHNSGEVELDPYRSSCSATDYTIDVQSNTEFYDIEFNGSQSCGKSARFTTATGDTVNATHDLIQTNGYLNGMWEVKNDLFLGSSSDGGLGTIIFNGTGAQAYDVASSAVRTCIIMVDKTAGAVSPATGTTDFNVQGFELLQGSFTAPSGTMAIGGTFSANTTLFQQLGGSFSHNNGSVVFDPYRSSCSVTTYTIDVDEATTFYDLTLEGSQSCGKSPRYSAGLDSIHVQNVLTLTNGYLDVGYLETEGNVNVESTYDGGAGTLIFTGSSVQDFDLTGATSRYNGDIVLLKTNLLDSVRLISDLVLDASGQEFQADRGVMHSYPGHTLYFGSGTSATQNEGYIEGYVYKAGTNAFDFPVGRDSVAASVSISAPGNALDTFRAAYFKSNPGTDGYSTDNKGTGLQVVSTVEYWVLDRVNGSASPTVTLTWRSASEVTDLSAIRVAHWNATSSQWENKGNTATSGGPSSGSVTSSAVASFSPFTLASSSSSNVLPIELLSFEALRVYDDVALRWTTQSEVGNDFFKVQRSLDNETWQTVLYADGAGTSTSSITYMDTDFDVPAAKMYYRLVQVDVDGDSSVSHTVFVPALKEDHDKVRSIEIYPNPAQRYSEVVMMFKDFEDEELLLTLRDIKGREYWTKLVLIQATESYEVLDIGSEITPGTYIITASSHLDLLSSVLIIK